MLHFNIICLLTIILFNCTACISVDSAARAGVDKQNFSKPETNDNQLSMSVKAKDNLAKELPVKEEKTALATIYQAPYPGDYKLVEITDPRLPKDQNQEEVWQARGQAGNLGGVLTVSSFGSGPKTFNCWAASDAESGGIASLMYESLLDIDPWTAKFYPRLASSFNISADHKDYTFTLRKGLRWSDGQPLTADDVVYTFGTLIAKGFGNSSSRDVLTVYGHYPSCRKN